MNEALVTSVVSWLADRLSEKSTYVGLGLLVASLGIHLAPDAVSQYSNIGLALGGLLAVVVKDKNVPASPTVSTPAPTQGS